jgi:hypothetical protein
VQVVGEKGRWAEMRMCDVRVGMRLRSTLPNDILSPITVTELTERGFTYSIDREMPFIPRDGLYFRKDGHEHFGFNGEAFYELIDTE